MPWDSRVEDVRRSPACELISPCLGERSSVFVGRCDLRMFPCSPEVDDRQQGVEKIWRSVQLQLLVYYWLVPVKAFLSISLQINITRKKQHLQHPGSPHSLELDKLFCSSSSPCLCAWHGSVRSALAAQAVYLIGCINISIVACF